MTVHNMRFLQFLSAIKIAVVLAFNALISFSFSLYRGCSTKKFTNVLLYTVKMIDPRVKSPARGQTNGSRALKCGIVHISSLITFRDTTSFIEI